MFIGFIGSPISGKTTVAAKVFAELKQSGQPNVEFVAEQARFYIAKKKYDSLMNTGLPDSQIVLTDDDQKKIFHDQVTVEKIMSTAVDPNGIVVCDSLSLNSLWYMSENLQNDIFCGNELSDTFFKTYNWYFNQLIFLCNPVHMLPPSGESLRLHSMEESRKIHDKINHLLINKLHSLNKTITRLNGPIDLRVNDVIRKIYSKLGE